MGVWPGGRGSSRVGAPQGRPLPTPECPMEQAPLSPLPSELPTLGMEVKAYVW